MGIITMINSTSPTNTTATTRNPYFETSLDPLPLEIRNGMIAMGTIGLLSAASTAGLLIFITHRMITWQRHYDHPIGKNQVFLLIYNLLLADLQQGIGFLLSFYWLSQDKLVGPSPTCSAQGYFIQIGDMGSGLWVLSIAVHTFIHIVWRKTIPMRIFVTTVVALWAFLLIIAAIGPLTHQVDFFVPTGSWCWISPKRQWERLYLHYIWIFLAQLGSIVIYLIVVIFLRAQISSAAINQGSDPNSAASKHKSHDPFAVSKAKIIQTARYMVLYPFAYVALTLPLAAVRVSAMAGKQPETIYYLVAGSMMASCGWLDVMLYISTRRVLVSTKKVAHSGLVGNLQVLVGKVLVRENKQAIDEG